MAKKLYRSRKSRIIAGICGGIAEYFDIDPIIVRLITLILVLSAGGGFIVYIIAWIVVPEEPETEYPVPIQ
jgi:phage shock protein C